jgi:general secretion pathway protein G
MTRPTRRRRRLGFTLVEMMVIMVILGVLIALLVPAIGGAVKSANAARVTAEINNMATALAQFKTAFSDYPPSRIILNESGNYSTTDATTLASVFSDTRSDITVGQLSQRTVRYMSKFFPRALCFSTTGSGIAVDINGNGSKTEVIYLDGGECLVFFLAGLTQTSVTSTSTDIGLQGFSRNPQNPFDRVSTSRVQPFYEFKAERLVDIDNDGFPSYNDALAKAAQGRYYAYFSAYGGNSYDPNDCNINLKFDQNGVNAGDTYARAFQVNFTVNSGTYNSCFQSPSATLVCVSPSPNPYTTTAPVVGSGLTVNWQNPQTFQIISAGADQVFGVAGQYAGSNAANRLPIPSGELSGTPAVWNGGLCSGQTAIDGDRMYEADDLANFAAGRLNQ